jgi:hypothetical protein
MDQWLIRTSENKIAGPYTKEQVCRLISEGKLTVLDEVCPANGYWIYLNEKQEVLKYLGVEIQGEAPANDEEITETETSYEKSPTDPTGPFASTTVVPSSSNQKRKVDPEAPVESINEESSISKGWVWLLVLVVGLTLVLVRYFLEK